MLNVTGEHGTAKTSLMELVRALVDPNSVVKRRPPREERDLHIAAANARVLTYDNLSELKDWQSDAFANLATGGGFAVRTLYTDDDEQLFFAECPIIINGINDVVTRGDLADRSIGVDLELIEDSRRRERKGLMAAFERDRPAILGGLLTAVSRGLRRLPQIKLDKLPRMADFARWAVACGDSYLWKPGEFIKAYNANRSRITRDVVEADPVANGIRTMITSARCNGHWSGTATELLERLETIVGEKEVKRKQWPASAGALGQRLKRVATPLRRLGIEIERDREGKGRERTITITRHEGGKDRKLLSASSSATPSRDGRPRGNLQNAVRPARRQVPHPSSVPSWARKRGGI
jgi:hypothetical protein